MSLSFEDALKYWGKDKLEESNPGLEVDLDTVYVDIEIDPGYQCCGPNDWDNGCYCSLAESASAYLEISGKSVHGSYVSKSLSKHMDFMSVIRELDQTAGRVSG